MQEEHFVCKFCDIKVSETSLGEHLLGKHFKKCYRALDATKQAEISRIGEALERLATQA